MLPANEFVPDFVIALTIIPLERPCVASNRFAITWNSWIASRLKPTCSLSPPEW